MLHDTAWHEPHITYVHISVMLKGRGKERDKEREREREREGGGEYFRACARLSAQSGNPHANLTNCLLPCRNSNGKNKFKALHHAFHPIAPNTYKITHEAFSRGTHGADEATRPVLRVR